MRCLPTTLPGVVIIEPDVHHDARGFFLESFRHERYAQAGLPGPFVQDNHCFSHRHVLRGLHVQTGRPQGKLVRAVEGEMLDVAVDVRRGSPSFGLWVAVRLSGENFRQLYLPPGFAHGLCALSERVHAEYKCSAVYDPQGELAIAWNDPELAIEWPVAQPLLSPRDAAAPRLREVLERLPVFEDPQR